MGVFGRKETVEPEEVTGNDILRQHLKHFMVRPGLSLADVARHLNEDHAAASGRVAVNQIAANMTGDADAAMTRSLAKTLLGSLGGDAKPSAVVSPQQLENYANGKIDLSSDVKSLLAGYFHDGAVYDQPSGLLKYPDAPPYAAPLDAPRPPDPYRHPSPAVAAAWDNYQLQLRIYNGTQPSRTTPIPGLPGEPARAKVRPGWKS